MSKKVRIQDARFTYNIFAGKKQQKFICIPLYPHWGWVFQGCSRNGGRHPLPKLCHTYTTKMRLGTVIPFLKKTQKYLNHVTHLLSSANISIFHRKSASFAISENTNIDCTLVHNF